VEEAARWLDGVDVDIPDPTTTSWGTRRIPSSSRHTPGRRWAATFSRPIVAVPAGRPPNSHGCQDWFSPGISWNQLDPPPGGSGSRPAPLRARL